ncbi:hypothetical protein GOV12_04735 [Candidatus Pacearchaeota archaeon]|nr:hypothetical protein [Candidatus Pacearchaeota archaeon]
MKIIRDPKLIAQLSRLVLESLVKLTEDESRSWVYFPTHTIIGVMDNYNEEIYGVIQNGDISKLLEPYIKKNLVVRPSHLSNLSDSTKPVPIRMGGYRANDDRLDELKSIIADTDK